MSPLRMPQRLAESPQVDTGEAVLRFELLENLDAGLRRCEWRVQAALAELREHDADGADDPDQRARLLAEAADAVWALVVQHEACDCADHEGLIRRYAIPHEVLARIGAAH
ncbi:conserved hypothetical protein [Phenylobacterium zucineum HLK1]|uniref:Uncharacterized protein n=1 Tax=Phenylobacterium zucineum (strain HLK1) TaxID=450851 RepID=B4RGR8_PHEZH|nr:DUF6665 family protein [Phenylobacterium zucineum]ACG77284.1 conserved hypothetical protein [Phenylobacterium zucineum HLK1]